MHQIIFDSAYDYYKLSELERYNLIGNIFIERNRDGYFFPINLTEECGHSNYGHKYGLLFLSPIISGKWFRLGVFSPDDMDMDLEFIEKDISIYYDIMKILRELITKEREFTYMEILQFIQSELKAGVLN